MVDPYREMVEGMLEEGRSVDRQGVLTMRVSGYGRR